jgi:voltage-gated sodium channel
MVGLAHRIVESRSFQNLILTAILGAGVVVGLETYPAVMEGYGQLLRTLDWGILYLFAVEILLKIIAHRNKPWEFFRNSWNVFDFVIVLVCFLPLNSHFVAVLRLARILRVLRLVTVLPRLQVLVGALLRSIPSMGYVGMLLFIHFYIYAVIGTFVFGANDPGHFGTLGASLLTLFQVVTLEGWMPIMQVQMAALPGYGPPLYFISFIVVGGMIILNLFIGVIMNSMQESTAEIEARRFAKAGTQTSAGLTNDDFVHIERQLADIQKQIAVMRHRIGS